MRAALRSVVAMILGRCRRHDPMFDTLPSGERVFRCQRCLHTWPRLSSGDGSWRPEVDHAARAVKDAFWAAHGPQAKPFRPAVPFRRRRVG